MVLSTMALGKGERMCLGEVSIHQLNESIFVRFQKICQLKLDFLLLFLVNVVTHFFHYDVKHLMQIQCGLDYLNPRLF